MQTPDPPNLNRCCWVRVYNPRPFLPLLRIYPAPPHLTSMTRLPSCSRSGYSRERLQLNTPPHPCFTTTLMSFSFTQTPQTATDQNGVHVVLLQRRSSPLMAPFCCNVGLSLSPAPRKGHNQCRDAHIVFPYVYRVVWRWWLILHLYRQTDTQTDTGTCWRDRVCLLRVFAETKDLK